MENISLFLLEKKLKKLLSTLACGTILATTVSAEFVQVKMGAGLWMNAPISNLTYAKQKKTGIFNQNATTNGYAWVSVKHLISLLPNIRLEYVSTEERGKIKGDFVEFKTTDFANIKFTTTQYDLIPYYNILDNTNWILDLGFGARLLESDYTVSATKTFSGSTKGFFFPIPIPFLYIRAKTQTAIKNISIESDAKVAIPPIGFDIRAKVDYTLDLIPYKPTIGVGYRVQGSAYNVLNASGFYAGLNLSF